MIVPVATIQTVEQIHELLERLHSREIAGLQVLGINSLKSLTPTPDALVGETVTGTEVAARTIVIRTTNYRIVIDLQRTGRLVWLETAEPYTAVAGASQPTVRLLLDGAAGLDLTEPARTKRITVTLASVVK